MTSSSSALSNAAESLPPGSPAEDDLKEIEKNVRSTKHWEVLVRLDDGSYQTLKSDVAPYWHGGERVRLLDGKLTPAT